MTMNTPKAIVFVCNWHAYRALELAGRQRQSYPVGIRPVRVPCLGRVHPGLILKAFQGGARGVLLLGCPPGQCRHHFGNRSAQDVLAVAGALIRLLGLRETQLQLDCRPMDTRRGLSVRLQAFVDGLRSPRVQP